MLAEITALMAAARNGADRATFAASIVGDNCLGKKTEATRRLTNQRLGELYALDPSLRLFRVFRRLWGADDDSRPLLALLISIARDPLLMATANPVLHTPEGTEFRRSECKSALREATGDRLNDAVLDKVLRNTASTWTQSGHLEGRTFKSRRRVGPSPFSVAFALYLAHLAGFRGYQILTSSWLALLDCSSSRAEGLAGEAHRLGIIDMRSAGGVFEIDVEPLDPGRG